MPLEIVCGPMFSGKSSYAIAYVRRHKAIGKRVIAVKPALDSRYSTHDEMVSHNQDRIPCVRWNTDHPFALTCDMLQADVVVIEEAQFFKGLYDMLYVLLTRGKEVLMVGLDGTSDQTPFADFLQCIPLATHVTKLSALCLHCRDGTLAPYTRALVRHATEIEVGGADKYESVCFRHLRGASAPQESSKKSFVS